jgi:HTH-type transcriptional regulator / antitoxin HipB
MKTLSEIIIAHRRLSGLSQAGLAKLAGVGKTVVFDLEHGKQSVRFDTLAKILSVLNITITFESPIMERLRAASAGDEGLATEPGT